jgi:hypothetical protein
MKTTLTLALLGALAMPAAADVTKDDLKKLASAGVSDDVTLAFVRANAPVHRLSADDVVELKAAGLSDRVLAVVMGPVEAPAPAVQNTVVAPQETTYVYPSSSIYVSAEAYPTSSWCDWWFYPSLSFYWSSGSGDCYPRYSYPSYYRNCPPSYRNCPPSYPTNPSCPPGTRPSNPIVCPPGTGGGNPGGHPGGGNGGGIGNGGGNGNGGGHGGGRPGGFTRPPGHGAIPPGHGGTPPGQGGGVTPPGHIGNPSHGGIKPPGPGRQSPRPPSFGGSRPPGNGNSGGGRPPGNGGGNGGGKGGGGVKLGRR